MTEMAVVAWKKLRQAIAMAVTRRRIHRGGSRARASPIACLPFFRAHTPRIVYAANVFVVFS